MSDSSKMRTRGRVQSKTGVRGGWLAFVVLVSWAGTVGCGDDEAGDSCDRDSHCDTGYCCDKPECRGYCTYRCGVDRDCPSDMGCEHGVCLFLCSRDSDCAPRETCEHNSTVCEY
jgi:hypothetical protein